MTTGIIWVTYAKDFEWFCYSARSYKLFASGFSAAVCVVPDQDRDLFGPVCAQNGIRLITGSEWPGRGMVWHMMQKCRADEHLPHCDIICHMDADCVFHSPTTPSAFLRDGLPVQYYTCFDALHPYREGRWKPIVDIAIGGDVKLAVMMGHPLVFNRSTYPATRVAVEAEHPEGFDAYVRSCDNLYPQGFCEFETLGAIAQTIHHHLYAWQAATPWFSNNFVTAGWSHGGLDAVTDRFDGKLTARQYFTSIGVDKDDPIPTTRRCCNCLFPLDDILIPYSPTIQNPDYVPTPSHGCRRCAGAAVTSGPVQAYPVV